MNKKKKEITFKKLIGTIHLWLGLISGLILFIVAIAAATYVFQDELQDAFQTKYYHTQTASTTKLPLDVLRDSVAKHFPKEKITSIRFKGDKDAAYIFYTNKKLISVNPSNAMIIGVRETSKDFFTIILKIHTELYLGEVGAEIIKWNVLIFFIMCLSGLFLWFPKKAKYLKQALKINFRTKNWKRFTWELHNVLGFYALLIFLLISLTGIFMKYDTAKNIASFITTGKSVPKEKKQKPIPPSDQTQTALNYQAIYDSAKSFDNSAPIESIVTFPNKKNTDARIALRYPYNFTRSQNTFLFSASNGKLISKTLYRNYTAYDKIAMSNYNLHTGRIGSLGIFSKIIYFIAALIAASLPITGFLIWRNKRKKKPAAAGRK